MKRREILRGIAGLTLALPRTPELVVNANTARALGLPIPTAMLARADRVIQ